MTNAEIEKKVEELLSQMTLEEKIGQMNQAGMPPEERADTKELYEKLKRGEIGSFIMAATATAGNDDTEIIPDDIFAKLQQKAVNESRLGIPVIFGRDVIHGHHTVLPIPLGIAAAFNPEQVRLCYRDIAAEAAREGVHWSFSPMLDVSRDPRWGRCVESPGEDPYVGMKMAQAVVEGFQGDDLSKPDCIAACCKHYIGYGASEGGRDYHKAEISDYTLRNYYLKAFKAAVDSGVQTVMNSFNEIGGQPTASSHYLLTEVLRDELGFDGYVISDWNAVSQLIEQGVAKDRKDAARLAINAGLDMDMVDDCYADYGVELVKEGKIKMEVIDESVRRILRVKLRLGLFENPYVPRYKVDLEKHAENARALADETLVLLKNEKNVLPLGRSAKVALIGPLVNENRTLLGTWTLDGNPDDVVKIPDAFLSHLNEDGKLICPSTAMQDDQLSYIPQADVVVLCLGESIRSNGEANSLAKIEVPEEQITLAKRAKVYGKPVIAVMCFGRPVAMTELEPYCDAIVYAWHPGTQAGNAITDVLFGDVNPSGKLPMTMPRCTGQIPIYYNAPSSGRTVNGYYGEEGNYLDCQGTPMYPFGYGLTYTEFQLKDIAISDASISVSELKNGKKLSVSVSIENTGKYDGKEVVQLYIHDKLASMTRPLRELKAFEKIFVEKGKSAACKLEIGYDELAFYNGQREFTVEPGEFEIFVGTDCYADNKLTLTVSK